MDDVSSSSRVGDTRHDAAKKQTICRRCRRRPPVTRCRASLERRGHAIPAGAEFVTHQKRRWWRLEEEEEENQYS